MKLPRFLANSYLTDVDVSEFDYDNSDFFQSSPDDYVEHFKVTFNDYNTNIVEIKDATTNKVYTFTKHTFEMGSYMEVDVLEYTFCGYEWGRYFEFDEDDRVYTEIEPFKYFNEFAEKYIESGKNDFLYLTDGFEDLNLLIPDCAEDRATNLKTIEDVTEFMKSLGYERLGA